MQLGYLLIWATVALLAASAVLGLIWAGQHGQFTKLSQGALAPFDHDEIEAMRDRADREER